jgi:hypothetical protein
VHLTINKGVRWQWKAAGGGGRFGGIWDVAVDNSSMAAWDDDDGYVGGGTVGRLSNSGLRCPS